VTFAERLVDLSSQFSAARDRARAEAQRRADRFEHNGGNPQDRAEAERHVRLAEYYDRQIESAGRGLLRYEADPTLTGGYLGHIHGGYTEAMSEAIRTGRYEVPTNSPQQGGIGRA
jgi:hypothetical protein